jgi:hypothetical protein
MVPHRPFGLPWPVAAGFALFVAVIVGVVATALMPRSVATFAPSLAPVRPVAHGSVDTVTFDARSGEEWRFFDLDRGTLLVPPDTAGWDLAARRFRVIGATVAIDLGKVGFADARRVPEGAWVATDWGRDTVNAALDRWYRYGFLSHLLRPKGHVYAVRTSDGGWAKLEFLSYYCPGPEAGCVTVRYAGLNGGP